MLGLRTFCVGVLALHATAAPVLCQQVPDSANVAPGREQALRPSVYVERITLSEVHDSVGFGLNIGAIVTTDALARGIQKAADVYGLNLDVFVIQDPRRRLEVAKTLVRSGESLLIMDTQPDEDLATIEKLAQSQRIPFQVLGSLSSSDSLYDRGFAAVTEARASLLPQIPKYDQTVPIAFPVTPLPDNFFQASKFPYPSPLVRAPRTRESVSASVHAHVSCNMVAQTGNMLHRTSSKEPNRLLMGMEGGNLSLHALPGSIDKPKISAVMTSWVLNITDAGRRREVLVENNGLESSLFHVGIHAPEELALALEMWRASGKIRAYRFLGNDEVVLEGWGEKDRRLRAGMFLIANEKGIKEPTIIQGKDRYGANTVDFFSTQGFVQQLVEVIEPGKAISDSPEGGLLTNAGTTVGNNVGKRLSDSLIAVPQSAAPVTPYILILEGGFLVVTPEAPLRASQLESRVSRIYLDLRGPLTSDQTILMDIESGDRILFRRTVLDFGQLDEALNTLRAMGMIEKWDYEGSRGRGLYANVVLYNFLGKHRRFMSSLSVWPTDERQKDPVVRFYVDGMQRLNFAFMNRDGWRQEFVEVPLRVPPVPRDVALYTGRSSLE